jgi:hypothetical protein
MIAYLKNIFQIMPKRYEVMSLMCHMDIVDENLAKAQNQGWEICGDVLLKNSTGQCYDTYFHIPMKRLRE